MPADPTQPGAAMEGRGCYNRYALLPGGGGALALPHLERAIAHVPLGSAEAPIVIADYGAFERNGRCGTLVLEESETCLLRDLAWDEYEKDGDAKVLAEKHAMFFRAIFAPTLTSALTRVREGDTGAFAVFADRLTMGLRRRLEAKPAHMHSLVKILVVKKTV